MKDNIAWELDLPGAKRAMKIEILKTWLFTSLIWGVAVGCLVLTPSTALLHIEKDSFFFLLFIGSFLLLYPSFFIGLRRWLEQDARLIWKDSTTTVTRIQAWVSTRVSSSPDDMAKLPMYWHYTWNGYWEERAIAIQAVRQHGELAESPPQILRSKLSPPVNPFYALGLPTADFINKPRKWYELVIAIMLIFLTLGTLMLVVAYFIK